MPEEIEDLKREGISLKEEDIMKPDPSQEQMALWQEIEKNITEKILERDNLFGSLSKDIRTSLASEFTSNKLEKIGKKYNFNQDQVIALARYIKTLFIDISKEKAETSQLINSLCSDLDIDPQKVQTVFQEINNEILLPTLKGIPEEKETSQKSSVPKPSTIPKSKDERVIDLKNQ